MAIKLSPVQKLVDVRCGAEMETGAAAVTTPATYPIPIYANDAVQAYLGGAESPIPESSPAATQHLIGRAPGCSPVSPTLDADDAYDSDVYATDSGYLTSYDPSGYTGLMRLAVQAKLGAGKNVSELAPWSIIPQNTGLIRSDDFNYYVINIDSVNGVVAAPLACGLECVRDWLERNKAGTLSPALSDDDALRWEAYLMSRLTPATDAQGVEIQYTVLNAAAMTSAYDGRLPLCHGWHFSRGDTNAGSIVTWRNGVGATTGDWYWETTLATVKFSPTGSEDIGSWAADTVFPVWRIISSGGYKYRATVGGESGSTPPTFPAYGSGGTVIDNDITWKDMAWVAATAFTDTDLIFRGTHYYRPTIAGTTGAIEPVWVTDGGTVSDGTVTWLDMGETSGISATLSTPEADIKVGIYWQLDKLWFPNGGNMQLKLPPTNLHVMREVGTDAALYCFYDDTGLNVLRHTFSAAGTAETAPTINRANCIPCGGTYTQNDMGYSPNPDRIGNFSLEGTQTTYRHATYRIHDWASLEIMSGRTTSSGTTSKTFAMSAYGGGCGDPLDSGDVPGSGSTQVNVEMEYAPGGVHTWNYGTVSGITSARIAAISGQDPDAVYLIEGMSGSKSYTDRETTYTGNTITGYAVQLVAGGLSPMSPMGAGIDVACPNLGSGQITNPAPISAASYFNVGNHSVTENVTSGTESWGKSQGWLTTVNASKTLAITWADWSAFSGGNFTNQSHGNTLPVSESYQGAIKYRSDPSTDTFETGFSAAAEAEDELRWLGWL